MKSSALEKGMATYSSIPAWRIPWTEEPGRLWPIGLPRVAHNWSNLTHNIPFSWEGKSSSFPLMSAYITESKREGMLFTCWTLNKAQFMFPWSSHSEKKSCSDPQNNPRRGIGRSYNGPVHWKEQGVLNPRVTKQPKEKALCHAWAMLHVLDRCFLFHTELCSHIYCCKCFRANSNWRVQFLKQLESRLVGDWGAVPLRREPFFSTLQLSPHRWKQRRQSPLMLL